MIAGGDKSAEGSTATGKATGYDVELEHSKLVSECEELAFEIRKQTI